MRRQAYTGIKLPQVLVVAAVVLIVMLQSVFFSNKVINNIKHIQNDRFNDLQQYRYDSDTNTNANTDKNIMIDPEATDCTKILTSFLNKQVKVAKNHNDIDYRRSFVAISDFQDIQPFYVATHDEKIDGVRKIIFNKHYYYEVALTKFIAEYFKFKKDNEQPSIFLDVGANIGWFSLVAAAHGASQVYSFEPNLQNTIRFCESLSLNRWLKEDRSQDVVLPISKGLGDTEDQKQMFAVEEFNPGSFTFSKKHAKRFPLKDENDQKIYDEKGNKVLDYKVIDTLTITTLDLFAERHGWFDDLPSIGIMKIDVEHFELEVLEGAKKLLQSQMIEIITFELKTNEPRDRKSRILQLLFEAGYRLHMHGTWQGPKHIVEKVYMNWKDLLKDFDEVEGGKTSLYRENVLFKLSSTITDSSMMVDYDTEVKGDNNNNVDEEKEEEDDNVEDNNNNEEVEKDDDANVENNNNNNEDEEKDENVNVEDNNNNNEEEEDDDANLDDHNNNNEEVEK